MGEFIRKLQRLLPLFCTAGILTLTLPSRAWAAQSAFESLLITLAFIAFVLAILLVLFIPTIVAFRREHPNRWLIFVVNLAFGGTVVGWVAALVWALHYAHISEDGSNGGESGVNLFVNDPVNVHADPTMNGDQNRVLAGSSINDPSVSSDHSDAESVQTLRRLKTLFENGAISAEEYTALKAPILNRYIQTME